MWLIQKKYFCVFFSKPWRAIPDVSSRRLSEAKMAEKGVCFPLLATKYGPDMVKTDRNIKVGKLWFFDCLRKCHVGHVTVGGASVVSTSGFRFPVGHDINRSTCSGNFLENA